MSENDNSQSVTALSELRHYHYQYSSIRDSIHNLHPRSKRESESLQEESLEQKLLKLISDRVVPNLEHFILLNTDITSIFREYSPTLEEREVVYKPNVNIKGNKPVGIGHHISCIGYNVSLSDNSLCNTSDSSWNIPLSLCKVGLLENKNAFTATQLREVLSEIGRKGELTINCLDSNYHSPEYIAGTSDLANLVNIIRISSSRNVWGPAVDTIKSGGERRGAKAVYGEKYKLSEFQTWNCAPCQEVSIPFIQRNGKEVIVRIQCWKQRKVRTKRGVGMKALSCNLVRIEMLDKEGEPLHRHSLWLTVWGERRAELSLKHIFLAYRKRFDIEHFFRFAKQRLLLDSFQTPDLQHSKNWLKVVQLSYWVLWTASVELREEKLEIPKWQAYLGTEKKRIEQRGILSPTQVQKNIGIIFSTFDQTPFLPKGSKNKTGRKLNEKQLKRKSYPINFKTKKKKQKVNSS